MQRVLKNNVEQTASVANVVEVKLMVVIQVLPVASNQNATNRDDVWPSYKKEDEKQVRKLTHRKQRGGECTKVARNTGIFDRFVYIKVVW